MLRIRCARVGHEVNPTEEMLRPWSQQPRRFTPRRGTVVVKGVNRGGGDKLQTEHQVRPSLIGLYTILPLLLLYGVLHTQGVSGEGRILRIRRAKVLQ